MTTTDTAIAGQKRDLRKLGAQRKRQRAAVDKTVKEMHALVIALAKAGVTHKEITDLSGYNQRQVSDTLARAGISTRTTGATTKRG